VQDVILKYPAEFYAEVLSEVLSTYDYFSRSLTAYRTYITPVSLSGVVSRKLNMRRLLVQSLFMSDIMEKKFTVYRHLLAGVSLLDTISGCYYFVLSDSLTPVELLSRVISLHRSFADVFSVTDYYDRVVSYVRELVGVITLSDYLGRVISCIRELSDVSVLSEYVIRTLGCFREFKDTTTLSEYFMRLINYVRELGETISVGEVISLYLSLVLTDYVLTVDYLVKIFTSVLSDSLSLFGLLQRTSLPRPFIESLELYDIVLRFLTVSRVLSEVVSLFHIFKYYHVYREYFSEVISLSDFIFRSKIYSMVLSEPIVLVDNLLKSVSFHREFADALILYSVLEFLRSKVLREVLSLLDFRIYTLGLVLSEPLVLRGVLQSLIIKTLFDSFVLTSNLSRRINCIRVITEFINVLDLISKYPMISLSELVGVSAIIASVTETSVMKVITELINIFKVSSIYDTDIVKVLSDLVNINDGDRDSEETE